MALRPCFAGSGLFRWRRSDDTGGVVVGMSWEFCAKFLGSSRDRKDQGATGVEGPRAGSGQTIG